MGEAFVTRRGGGTSLNFDLTQYATEAELLAATPKKYTIGIISTTEITSWDFIATEPDTPSEGMVWISVGKSSHVEFNALKKNGIQVYPISAKQYVDGAWVDKTAKSYQNGAWVDWSFWIVSDGDIKEPPGFGAKLRNSTTATLTDEGAYLVADTVNDTSCGFTTPEKCDVTNYKRLVLVCDIDHIGNTTGGIGVGVSLATALNADTVVVLRNNIVAKSIASTTGKQTLELDLTGFSGLYYPSVHMDISSGKRAKVYIYDFYME